MAFKSSPGVSLFDSMAPFLKTDITNPRELYAMLSQTRHQDALLTSVNSQAGAKLPPLDTSSEVQFQSLQKQHQHSSYPDLATFRSKKGDHSSRDPIRRSSSLQDVSTLDLSHSGTGTRKLKPILRSSSDSKNTHEHNEKVCVKFGQKEVHLIREFPLPPIEGSEYVTGSKGSFSFSSFDDRLEEKASLALNHSPCHHRRQGADFSSDIFPRGQPVEVKKPVTPTYQDYPEAYWELRSSTVQDPSDLKEDMIDRDRYRLQQISSLRLRAMNRELAASKLDSYRKWQQQMEANSPTVGLLSKQDSTRGSVTPSMNGPATSARTGKQPRKSVPVKNDSLAVAATSFSPTTNPVIKKRIESSKTGHMDNINTALLNHYITEDEFRRRQKIEAAKRGENGVAESEAKLVKMTVVNLCIDPDSSTNSPTSDVFTGIRRIMFGPRPLSDNARTHSSLQAPEQGQVNVPKPPGSVSVASVNATVGSSHSFRFPRVPSAPTESVIGSSLARSADMTDADSSVANKKILKKFNKLQVFSEKYPARENASTEPWNVVSARPTEKAPYLPQSRPPTYKLDLRNYPIRHHSSGENGGGVGEEMGILLEGVAGFSLLTAERGVIPAMGDQSPHKLSETTSLSFRFGNGEVIVSRQGKKPKLS